MDCAEVLFSGHAVRRMFERGLSRTGILAVVHDGEVIVDYADDKPHPSCLLLGFMAGQGGTCCCGARSGNSPLFRRHGLSSGSAQVVR